MSNIENGSKLFMVKFGEPAIETYSSLADIKPLFVIATSFDKAGIKAYEHAVNEQELKNVIDGKNDNSLTKKLEVKVRSVKLISSNLIN